MSFYDFPIRIWGPHIIPTILKFLYFINIFHFDCVKQLSIREIQNKPVSVVKF